MKSDDINRLMPGFTIQGISQITGNPFTIQILADGVAEFEMGRTGDMAGTIQHETGKWWTENYRFCMQFSRFSQGQERCPRIVRQGEKLYATRANGERIQWTLNKP